jgi:hypothetical protein
MPSTAPSSPLHVHGRPSSARAGVAPQIFTARASETTQGGE